MDEVKSYVVDGLAGFAKDPADTDFQQGYEQALRNVLSYIEGVEEDMKLASAGQQLVD